MRLENFVHFLQVYIMQKVHFLQVFDTSPKIGGVAGVSTAEGVGRNEVRP